MTTTEYLTQIDSTRRLCTDPATERTLDAMREGVLAGLSGAVLTIWQELPETIRAQISHPDEVDLSDAARGSVDP